MPARPLVDHEAPFDPWGPAALALFVAVATLAAAWVLRRLRPWEWRVIRVG